MKDNYLEAEFGEGKLRLVPHGEIDHHSARTLREQMDQSIYCNRPLTVNMDLSCTTFMDSSGLGLIMGRLNAASEVGAVLSISHPSEPIRKILALSGVDKMVNIIR